MPGPADAPVTSRAAVRWGVLLPTFDAPHTGHTPDPVSGARRAEELGFDAGWVGDHLVCHCPVLEATMALSAAAAVTERLTLGFSVLLLGLRPTESAASQIATIDALSGGRFVLGVGVGGEFPDEFVAAGVPVSRRGRRLDDALAALPDLLAGRLPPILIGGRSEAALRRTVMFGDAWLPMWLSPDAVHSRRMRLLELAVAAGRPEPSLGLLVLMCVDEDIDTARAVAAEHLSGQYRLPLEVVERWTPVGPVEHVAEQLSAYLDAGVRELVVMPLGRRPLEQYERISAVRALLG